MVDAFISRGDDATAGFLVQHELHAPHLIDYEFLSAVTRLSIAGRLPPNIAREALELWRGLQIHRHPAAGTTQRTWDLRQNLSAYDAAYVALAEALDAPLLTADDRLARAASRYCQIV
jgi:predicted nucleic acid-binding protein